MKSNEFAPGRALYQQVRGGLIAQGTNLSEWCRKHGLSHTNARAALTGAWNGPKGQEIRNQLITDSGVTATGGYAGGTHDCSNEL